MLGKSQGKCQMVISILVWLTHQISFTIQRVTLLRNDLYSHQPGWFIALCVNHSTAVSGSEKWFKDALS